MKFKHLLMSLLAVVALAACGNNNDDPTPPPGNDDFEITVHDIFHTKCKLDVKAKNPEMPLYFGIYGKKDFETYVNDADFIQSIMENIERIANNYGMTLQELLESELKVGGVENFEYNDNVYPDTEYIAYAFGLDKQGNVLTGLNKVEFRTPAVGMEDCTFEITSVDMTATSFKVNVKPSNPNTEYYYDVMSSSAYQEVGSSADGIRSVVLSVMNRGIEDYGYTVYEAVQKNKPLIERVVTVTGKQIAEPRNLLTRMGTPVEKLIERAGGLPDTDVKVLNGGPMMGRAMVNLSSPVTKGCSGLTVISGDEASRGEASACIKCGKCVSACPMGLEPYLISKMSRKKLWDAAEDHNVTDCIECGCCSYSCPANIRLGKQTVMGIIRARAAKK